MVRRATARPKTSVTVDFKGVEGRTVLAEGDYEAVVKEISTEEGDKAEYFKWTFTITGPEKAGATMFYNTSLAANSLWNLRNLLETLGVEVPDGPLEIDFAELVGIPVGLSIVDDEYEGKKRSKVADFFPLEGGEAEPEPEPEPKKTLTRAQKRAAEKAKKEPEKLKADDVAEMSEDELTGVVDTYELGIDLDEFKTLRKKANAVLDALEEKELLEE